VTYALPEGVEVVGGGSFGDGAGLAGGVLGLLDRGVWEAGVCEESTGPCGWGCVCQLGGFGVGLGG